MNEKSAAILNKPAGSLDETAAIPRLSPLAVVQTMKRNEVAVTKVGTRYIIPTAPLRQMLHVEDAAVRQASAT